MKRALHILGMFALCMVIIATPNRAYALDYFDEQQMYAKLDLYTGNIFSEQTGWWESSYYLLNNVMTNNTQLAVLGQGAASKGAYMVMQMDFTRAIYATTYESLQLIDSNLPSINTKLGNLYSKLSDMKQQLSVLPGYTLAISNKTTEILTKTETISGDLLTLTQNVSTIGNTLAGNQGQQLSKLTDIKNLLTSIDNTLTEGQNVTVDVSDVTVSNMPTIPETIDYTTYIDDIEDYILQLRQTVMAMNNNVASISYATGDIAAMLQNGLTVNVANWPESFVDLSTIQTTLNNIYDFLNNNFKFIWDGNYRSLRVYPWDWTAGSSLNWVTQIKELLSGIKTSIDNAPVIDLTTTNNLLTDIKNLLKVQNMDNAIGAFDWLLFQQNANQLESDMTNTAPFGVIHLVGSLLALLSAAPVADPSLTMPFNFAGTNQNVVLSVSWLADLKNIISFVVVLGWILVLARISHDYMRGEVVG